MFLEWLGKIFFSRLHPYLFFCVLLLPVMCVSVHLFSLHSSLSELEQKFIYAAKKGKGALERKTRTEQFLARYGSADPSFLDRHIESLSFLAKEKEQLIALTNHPACAKKQLLRERLEYISSEKNRLVFSEDTMRSARNIKETEEKQRHPVQMDETDIQKLCAFIEDVAVGHFSPVSTTPQLLFLDFKMKRMENPFHAEIYEVETRLLKREWIH